MGLLETIQAPSDLRSLTGPQLEELAGEIRAFLIAAGDPDRRPPRPEPRRRRADSRHAPGLRLPARHRRLRHRPPVLRAQAADRAPGLLRAALAGWAVRLPQPGREPARRGRELARLDVPVLGRRHRQGAPAARRARPLHGRGDRRRRADRRHGLGGAQQHRRRQGPAARSSWSTTTSARTAPTIGGLAEHLATLRTTRGYERFLAWGKQTLHRTPVVGGAMYDALHGVKKGLKDIVAPQGMFEDLGLKYIGPVDGHDIEAVEHALRRARALRRPGPGARASPRRAAATSRPCATRPTGSTPSA